MAKSKQLDALEDAGAGVGIVKDRKLNRLGDEFIEARDQRALCTTKLRELETKIIDRMHELKIEVFRFGDKEMRIDLGKSHVKVKTVEAEGVENESESGDPQ